MSDPITHHPAETWGAAARVLRNNSTTRLRLAAMAGHMQGDKIAARRAALIDLLADGRPHTREAIWAHIAAQLVDDCWGKRPEEALWRDIDALRCGGIRIAYSRRPDAIGYYLQYPALAASPSAQFESSNPLHVAGIRDLTVSEKNERAFAAADFALRQKRLLLTDQYPDWTVTAIDQEARRLVFDAPIITKE
jgi:hypothetical protein